MSETELPTGHDFVEANHGLKPAPTEPETPEPEQYGGGFEELKRAANDHTAERGPSESEPVERFLEWKTGSKAGQRVDLKAEHMSLTPEQAAKTLSEVHRTEDAIEVHANLSELQREVDLARYQVATGAIPQDAQQQPAQSETPPPIDSPQPEAIEHPSGLSPKVVAALSDPEIRQAIEPALQQSEAARQAYVGAVAQAADVALSALTVNFPELAGYSAPQLGTVIAHIARTDPERAALIQDQIQKVSNIHTAAQQAKAQQAQMAYAQFQEFGKQQDAVFENATRGESKETIRAAAEEIVNFAGENGISKDTLAQLYATQPIMRSAVFQQMMLDAAKYRMATRSATANPHRQLPSVMRPGVAPSAGERPNVDLSELRNEFKKASGNEQIRLAAKLQQAQRRARG